MKRGDVVLVPAGGEDRSFVVVQGGWTLDLAETITICPVSFRLLGVGRVRVSVQASPENGLSQDGEIAVDRMNTVRRSSIGRVVGTLSTDAMRRVDRSLKNWLDL